MREMKAARSLKARSSKQRGLPKEPQASSPKMRSAREVRLQDVQVSR
jgi:hypothetical protein